MLQAAFKLSAAFSASTIHTVDCSPMFQIPPRLESFLQPPHARPAFRALSPREERLHVSHAASSSVMSSLFVHSHTSALRSRFFFSLGCCLLSSHMISQLPSLILFKLSLSFSFLICWSNSYPFLLCLRLYMLWLAIRPLLSLTSPHATFLFHSFAIHSLVILPFLPLVVHGVGFFSTTLFILCCPPFYL